MTHNKEIFLIGKKKSDGFLDMEYRFNDAAGRQTSNNCDDDFPLSPPVVCSAHPALALPPARPELLPLSPKILLIPHKAYPPLPINEERFVMLLVLHMEEAL